MKWPSKRTQIVDHEATDLNGAFRFSFTYLTLIVIALSANLVHSLAPAAVASACVVAALISPLRALQALSLLTVVRILNPAIVNSDITVAVISWLGFLCIALRYGIGFFRYRPPTAWPLILFAILVLCVSPFVSPEPTISSLKVASFTVVAVSLLIICNRLTDKERALFLTWLYMLTIAVILLSAPLLFAPQIGYLINGRGFQGILNHPQTFGVFFAPVCACLIMKALFTRDLSWFAIAALFLCLTAIALSQTRTSAFAVINAVTAITAYFLLRSKPGTAQIRRLRAVTVVIAMAIAVSGSVLLVPEFGEAASKFVFKRGSDNLGEELVVSRGSGALYQFTHFQQSPLVGHGFGIPSSGRFASRPVEIYGIPISAPVEKGFLPTAVLEETGLLGGVIILIWIVQAFRCAARGSSVVPPTLVAVGVFLNFGEMSFFSMNSMGLLFFLLIAIGITDGASRGGLTQIEPEKRLSDERN